MGALSGDLQRRASALHERIGFVGGPPERFAEVGANQLAVLLANGLLPASRVIDVGCGCLRGGYWIMRVLDPGCYFGIEPMQDLLAAGLEEIVEPDVLERAKPLFAHNSDWDLSVFGMSPDFVIARSIWSHAPKSQILALLDSFVVSTSPGARLLSSYIPTAGKRADYAGDEWVGRLALEDEAGLIAHDRSWFDEVGAQRGLVARDVGPNVGGQVWLLVEHGTPDRGREGGRRRRWRGR